MSEATIIHHIATKLQIRPNQIQAALDLFADGNTIPFVARYRKEATGLLDEQQLRHIKEEYAYEEALASRKESVRQSIEEQGCWTKELEKALADAQLLQEVEDIYLPFKPKKRTKASMARDAGLKPLADLFVEQPSKGPAPEDAATAYVCDEYPDVTSVIQGACHIIAETASENGAYRKYLRKSFWRDGVVWCALHEEEEAASTYLTYKDFHQPVRSIPSHRVLAINRGEAQKALKVTLAVRDDVYMEELCRRIVKRPSPYEQILRDAAQDSYKRLIAPQMEREIRNDLTEKAKDQAIKVFAENLRNLLLQPPFAGQIILGLDPGYRTGCKAAVIDSTGTVLDYGTFYLTGSKKQQQDSDTGLTNMICRHGVTLISIGNGTASYETEQFVSHLIAEHNLTCRYIITNEAGASVYSASDLAREELPDLDVTIRGAVSIARRIQDPLAESVKIDSQSLGFGQYQHDVNQKALTCALDGVVESVVNYVGVDLNTASAALLQHVSGITAATAANIIAYRNENGPFHDRQELMNVNRLGPATFTQCAGFLRIKDGANPLDNTSVHPESYGLAKEIIEQYGFTIEDLFYPDRLKELQGRLQMNAVPKLAQTLKAGEPTVCDIIEELRKPGRDVRSEFPQPLTRRHVLSLDELKVGSIVRGTVHNVVDFGAFIDFGLKTAGLVHKSELCNHPFSHPTDVVHVGDIVDCMILSVDAKRGRIALSIKRAIPTEKS